MIDRTVFVHFIGAIAGGSILTGSVYFVSHGLEFHSEAVLGCAVVVLALGILAGASQAACLYLSRSSRK